MYTTFLLTVVEKKLRTFCTKTKFSVLHAMRKRVPFLLHLCQKKWDELCS